MSEVKLSKMFNSDNSYSDFLIYGNDNCEPIKVHKCIIRIGSTFLDSLLMCDPNLIGHTFDFS